MTNQPPKNPKTICLKCGAEQPKKQDACWLCGAVLGTVSSKTPIVDKPGVEFAVVTFLVLAPFLLAMALFVAFVQICSGFQL